MFQEMPWPPLSLGFLMLVSSLMPTEKDSGNLDFTVIKPGSS
jgi:hypothetical protein